ncbi:hypothetical protein [Alteromonas sp. PRIM-21]|uniref:hypothetical protein n=1 Tax=Alteromonas sp. PRIM-21 TaxID=1454978 RepID=UPI0022B99283|nr:hypothetical protein [Alteromonas sp. PRIM-21]MCZ8531611.1 hypothetical protein [Alteromonas sp. PRIM-21]
MKLFLVILLTMLLLGCAKGRVDILSKEGELLGSCTAEFNWHWHGVQDSVDYILYLCAKGHLENGKVISDPTILENDYGLPSPPNGQTWNKRSAYESYKSGHLSEQKYGYILAAIEYEYILSAEKARKQLDSGVITKKQYEQLVYEAAVLFNGK